MSALAVQALREIEALHGHHSTHEIEWWPDDQPEGEYREIESCDHCGVTYDGDQVIYFVWPCPTLRAAGRALAALGQEPLVRTPAASTTPGEKK